MSDVTATAMHMIVVQCCTERLCSATSTSSGAVGFVTVSCESIVAVVVFDFLCVCVCVFGVCLY